LYTFQVGYDLLSIGLLLVNNLLEHVELMVHLLSYLILQALLVEYALLHIGALAQISGAHEMDILQQINLLCGCLLERESSSPFILLLEVAVITQRGIVCRRVHLQLVLVLTKLDSLVLYEND